MRKLPFKIGDIVQGVALRPDECEELAVSYTIGKVIAVRKWNTDMLSKYVTLEHYEGHETTRSIQWYKWSVIKPSDLVKYAIKKLDSVRDDVVGEQYEFDMSNGSRGSDLTEITKQLTCIIKHLTEWKDK